MKVQSGSELEKIWEGLEDQMKIRKTKSEEDRLDTMKIEWIQASSTTTGRQGRKQLMWNQRRPQCSMNYTQLKFQRFQSRGTQMIQ